MVTLAPELPGALELIEICVRRGIVVSLGHSDASADEAARAFAAGASAVTHLFNAMAPIGGRAPGLAGAALATDGVAIQLIADGVHVADELIRLAFPRRPDAAASSATRSPRPASAMATTGSGRSRSRCAAGSPGARTARSRAARDASATVSPGSPRWASIRLARDRGRHGASRRAARRLAVRHARARRPRGRARGRRPAQRCSAWSRRAIEIER